MVSAVEDGEQIWIAVFVDDLVGLVDQQGRAHRIDHAEGGRRGDRPREERIGRQVFDAFEQRRFAGPFNFTLNAETRRDVNAEIGAR
jgi:hypothetical protein